ncbi:hypothetical protein SKAU_G00309910 [Synaphobranchus kaupii]|uniref:FYVE-type domain-containing protein n=1 Tax=Synaphobranchus kaupii TaxID=118154 RepID=A0A9Q1IL54_SYNKA|nr:hypothetical protein SKAU_G00309910 [Synaphobranchus kaupii]
MTEQLASAEENLDRILAVQSCFGPKGMPLNEPGRVLVGEGHLVKLCRRRHQPRVFFLFNDILVYGSILVHGRWRSMPGSRTSRSVATSWRGRFRSPGQGLAHSWVPDSASSNCMRCDRKFTTMHRRHHCRKCGDLVCGSCSNQRFLIPNISCTPKRVCLGCFRSLQAEKTTRNRGDSGGNSWSDESSSDEDGTELRKYPSSQQWVEQSNHVVQGWSSYSAK